MTTDGAVGDGHRAHVKDTAALAQGSIAADGGIRDGQSAAVVIDTAANVSHVTTNSAITNIHSTLTIDKDAPAIPCKDAASYCDIVADGAVIDSYRGGEARNATTYRAHTICDCHVFKGYSGMYCSPLVKQDLSWNHGEFSTS